MTDIKALRSAGSEHVSPSGGQSFREISNDLYTTALNAAKLRSREHSLQCMIPSPLPELPWQKVATDLFEWKQQSYLLIVDYYSRFIEIARLNGLTASEVITRTKSIFTRQGIPETVVSDNGPQYSSEAYKTFAEDYQFKHVTSSPYFPQSNGEAERAVRTIKDLLKKSGESHLALLAYRSTPLVIPFGSQTDRSREKCRMRLRLTLTKWSHQMVRTAEIAETSFHCPTPLGH